MLALEGSDFEASRKYFEQVIDVTPGSSDAQYFLGQVSEAVGQFEAALGHYRLALEIKPDFLPALRSMSPICERLDCLAVSESALRRARLLAPENTEVKLLLGLTQIAQRQWQDAADILGSVLSAQPGRAEALLGRAHALLSLGQFDQAAVLTGALTTIHPGLAKAHLANAHALLGCGNAAAGLPAANQALRLAPEEPEGWSLLSKNLWLLNRDEEALAAAQRALELDPSAASRAVWLAHLHFFLERWDDGWLLYEARLAQETSLLQGDSALIKRLAGANRWRGDACPEGELYLWGEQGLGDMLMMWALVKQAQERFGGQVFLYCPERLVRLAAFNLTGIKVLSERSDIPDQATHCPLMSLPMTLKLAGYPFAREAYLSAPRESKELFATRLAALPGFKVGLAWQGNPNHSEDQKRSIDSSLLQSLSAIPGVTLVSLQKGAAPHELEPFSPPLIDWTADIVDFADTAAIMQGLDLVISVDSAPAHLAGALQVPVWMLNRFGGEWRWGRGRQHNHWYASLSLFYQEEEGNWAPVIDAMCHALRQKVNLWSATR